MNLVECSNCEKLHRVCVPVERGQSIAFTCDRCGAVTSLRYRPYAELTAEQFLDLLGGLDAAISRLKGTILLLVGRPVCALIFPVAILIAMVTMGFVRGLVFGIFVLYIHLATMVVSTATAMTVRKMLDRWSDQLVEKVSAEWAIVPRGARSALSIIVFIGLMGGAAEALSDPAENRVVLWWMSVVGRLARWHEFPNVWILRILVAELALLYPLSYDIFVQIDRAESQRKGETPMIERYQLKTKTFGTFKWPSSGEDEGHLKVPKDDTGVFVEPVSLSQRAGYWLRIAARYALGLVVGGVVFYGSNAMLGHSLAPRTSGSTAAAAPTRAQQVSVVSAAPSPSAPSSPRPARLLTGCITLTGTEIHLRQDSNMSYHGSARVPAGVRLQVMERGSKTRGTGVAHRVLAEDGREGWMFLDPSRLDGPSCAEFRSGQTPVAPSQPSEPLAATATSESNSAVVGRFAGRNELRPSWEMRGVPSALDLAMTTSNVEQNALVVISAQWYPFPSESRTDGIDALVENGRFDNPTRQRFRWNPDGSEVTFIYVVPRTGQLTILTPRHEELNAPTYIGAPIESIIPWNERNGTEITYRENHRRIRVRVYRQASAQGSTTLQRTRWRVDDTGDWFERNSDGRWTEHRRDGVVVHFTETDRGVDFIELFDPDRQMAFRLYASGARWRVGNGEWNQWDHSGRWVE